MLTSSVERLDSSAARTTANGRCEAILTCSTAIVFDVRLALVMFRCFSGIGGKVDVLARYPAKAGTGFRCPLQVVWSAQDFGMTPGLLLGHRAITFSSTLKC